jgi:hypothetical protein
VTESTPTVITRISGGLGNQLFQYATGRAFADRSGAQLLLDISWYGIEDYSGTTRELSLPNFNINAKIAEPQVVESAFRPRILWRLFRTVVGRDLRLRRRVIDESCRHSLLRHPSGKLRTVLLRGYWQDESYFADKRSRIREELTLRKPLPQWAQLVQQKIRETRSVGIHVRRGDYVTNRNLTKTYGVCSPDYFRRSVEALSSDPQHFDYFVFSDDPAWVACNLLLPGRAHIVSGQIPSSPEIELTLMKSCNHFILSNSTFGWWAAWLGEEEDTTVCTPSPWFVSPEREAHERIVPPRWLRVPA